MGLSLILHDCGWSQLSETEIAQSLGVKGLALNYEALAPKERHAVIGEIIAKKLLSNFGFSPPLAQHELTAILLAVRHHGKPELVSSQKGEMPTEVQLLVDLDHLWSFTVENFWQDTLRKKNVQPKEYLNNLEIDLPAYFVTEWGKDKAQELLEDRGKEVSSLERQVRKSSHCLRPC